MKSFNELKSKKSKDAMVSQLLKKAEELKNKYSRDDDRFWQPTVDKSGNGKALIRFLPPPLGENDSFVEIFSYGFQNKKTGRWYIENSPFTIGLPDPVMEYNSAAWASGDKDTARAQKRKRGFISNIYVVKDPGNPENEGKVFLYKYGKKIHDMIMEKLTPEDSFSDEPSEPINVFDFWDGANFKMIIRQVDGFRNYDKCSFDDCSVLLDDDNKLKELWESQYSLQEFLDSKNFKSYEDLKNKFHYVLGTNGAPEVTRRAEDVEEFSSDDDSTTLDDLVAGSSQKEEADDETLDFLRKLAS